MTALIILTEQVFTGEPGGLIPGVAIVVDAGRIAEVGPARKVLAAVRGGDTDYTGTSVREGR